MKNCKALGLSLVEISLLFKVPNGLSQLDELISARKRDMEIVTLVISTFKEEQEVMDSMCAFVPKDLSELYEKLVKEDVKGEISKQEDWLMWRLPNEIILKIAVNYMITEGYIGVYYLKNGKEKSLTHWHPADDEIYRDLMEINHEDIIWIRKKSVFREQPPVFIERKRYDGMSERRKSRYSILPFS